MKRYFVTLITFYLVLSCGKDNKSDNVDDPVTINDDSGVHLFRDLTGDVQLSLIEKLDNYNISEDTRKDRPKDLSPKTFLLSLSNDFQAYFMPDEKIGEYTFIPLSTIGEESRNNILKSLKVGREYTGYAILSKNVWKHMFELQDLGYKVGLLETSKDNRIAGIYSDNGKRIGIDVMSGEITLRHEARHAQQYNAIRNSRTGKINGLSSTCYSDLHQLFAETDANTYEIPYWNGVFDRIEFISDWHRNRQMVLNANQDKIYPFTHDFFNSIDYPLRKTFNLLRFSDCSDEIKNFVKKIDDRISSYKSRVKPSAYALMDAGNNTFLRWKMYYEQGCNALGTALQGKDISDESCAIDKESNEEIIKMGVDNASKINDLLLEESNTRTNDLKAIYNLAPKSLKDEFCKEMIGFSFYADC